MNLLGAMRRSTVALLATWPGQTGEPIMSGNHHDDPGFEFEKDLEIDVDVDLEFDVDVEVDIDKWVDIDIYSDVDLDGNTAELTLDAQAIGDDTLVEAIVSVLTVDNEMSSISLHVLSATD
jgi:hypothetical protein